MKKVIVIGAGITGMSIAKMLNRNYEVLVYEKENKPGGMVKCDRIEGHLFHKTGGHVFNTKREDVFDWFWQQFNQEQEFTKADRNSVVSMADGRIIAYPIENHAYQFSDNMMKGFIQDLISMAKNQSSHEPQNFEEFLRARFGETLYKEYFQPYNEKIWRRPLTDVPLSWLAGKLPMPTLEEIIYNNFNHIEEKQFVHSSFYYPKHDGSQFIADRLAENLNIRYNTTVTSIEKIEEGWSVNGEQCDIVIFCGNIKDLPHMIKDYNIDEFINDIQMLEAHGTTTVLCEIEDNPYSWIYMPSREHQAHRIICTGNFAISNRNNGKMSATIEFTDYISKDDILENLSKIPYAPQYLAHNYCEYTYPIQAPGTREFINRFKQYCETDGLYLLGRFAEWEYYNMDVAMGAALDLSKKL